MATMQGWHSAIGRPAGLLMGVVLLAHILAGCSGGAAAVCPGGYSAGLEQNFRAVAYGKDLFVAGDATGNFFSSADGVTWTPQAQTHADLFGLTFGGGRFVAVTGCDSNYVSEDGRQWQSHVTGVDGTMSAPVHDSRQFLSFAPRDISKGVERTIYHSKDGVTWEKGEMGGHGRPLALTLGDGKYVAVGLYGYTYLSPDGVNWTEHRREVQQDLTAVAFGNGRFVAVGDKGVIVTSRDGATWQAQASGTTANLIGLTFANGKFVAVGTEETVLTSTDGVTWKRTWQPVHQGPQFWFWSVAYGNGKFLVVGDQRTVLISEDAEHWRAVQVPLDL